MAAPAGSENRGSRPSSATSAGARGPAAAAVTTVLEDGDAAAGDAVLSADEAALAALGYRQEFRREFGPWSTFAVSFAVMGLLPSIASTMWYGIGYGVCSLSALSSFFRSSPPMLYIPNVRIAFLASTSCGIVRKTTLEPGLMVRLVTIQKYW